jgi:3-demethoxyubiquinol 3-hydroxylase
LAASRLRALFSPAAGNASRWAFISTAFVIDGRIKVQEIERILRVDHAGEYGAINIYTAQLIVSRVLYKDIVLKLEEMIAHERKHFETFDNLLVNRSIRHCYALRLWAFGGFSLGLITAIIGRNAIWICTDSIETTVLNHLVGQLEFLHKHDALAYDAVLSIKADEESHQDFGHSNSTESFINKPLFFTVQKSTELAIWLSTKL